MSICNRVFEQIDCLECPEEIRPIQPSDMAFVIWCDSRDLMGHISGISGGAFTPPYHYVTDGSLNFSTCDVAHPLPSFSGTNGVTWPLYSPSPDPNTQFIHIGLFGDAYADPFLAVDFLCCLVDMHGIPAIPLHIIPPFDIDNTSDQIMLPDGWIDAIAACISTGGGPEYTNIYECCQQVQTNVDDIETIQGDITTIQDRITDLETCCTNNTQDTAYLQTQVQQNATDIQGLQSQMTSVISQIQEIMKALVNIQDCVNQVCGDTDPVCLEYRNNGSAQVPPHVPQWVNFATEIEDSDPPKVVTGPLWTACLQSDCNWSIEVTVRLAIGEWCDGEEVGIYLVACGSRYLLDTFTASGAVGSVTLTGSFMLATPPDCLDTHIEIKHTSVSEPFKVIEYGSFKACCN